MRTEKLQPKNDPVLSIKDTERVREFGIVLVFSPKSSDYT